MKFLGRARKFLQELASEPESKVQYFNVACAGGHRVRGERTEGYQALRCPACGEGVFVLPRSPLPEPPAPARRSPAKGARQHGAWVDDGPVELTDPGRVALDARDDDRGIADAENVWDDAPAESRRPRGPNAVREQPPGAVPAPADLGEPFWEEDLNRAALSRSPEASDRRRKPRDPAGRSGEERSRPVQKRRQATTAGARGRQESPAVAQIEIPTPRKKLSRLTVVLILVPLLVMTAVAWRYRRGMMQEYPLIAEKGRNEGIPALEEGDFEKAYQLLAAAKSAVDSLGGAVERADDIRNAAREAEIFVHLSPGLLEDMLEEAGRTDPTLWPSKFDTLFKGRTVLIDSVIKDEPEPGPRSRYAIEYVVFRPGGTTTFSERKDARPDPFGLIDLTGFELFELAGSRKGQHVTFGAKLASFQFDATNMVWWVGLEPGSGVFITHTRALFAIGFPGGAADELAPEAQP